MLQINTAIGRICGQAVVIHDNIKQESDQGEGNQIKPLFTSATDKEKKSMHAFFSRQTLRLHMVVQ